MIKDLNFNTNICFHLTLDFMSGLSANYNRKCWAICKPPAFRLTRSLYHRKYFVPGTITTTELHTQRRDSA